MDGAMEKKSTSTWFALRNPVFCRLWLASVLSGTFVSVPRRYCDVVDA